MSVTVVFEGICTHVFQDKLAWLPVPHRVVLANGRGAGHGIPDHVATLHILREHLARDPGATPYLKRLTGRPELTWEIRGACFEIPSGDKPDPKRPCMLKMPPVTGFDVNRSLVSGKTVTADQVNAFFDIRAGVFEGCCFGDAYGATLTVNGTELVVEPFDKNEKGLRIGLNDNAVIHVRHMAEDGRCEENDLDHFLLHYLIGGRPIPDKSKVPFKDLKECRGCKGCPKAEPTPPALGVGCSSSTYP